ncbi:MAG: hypothetical protein ACREV9_06635 [Burkholderiales bacterium]
MNDINIRRVRIGAEIEHREVNFSAFCGELTTRFFIERDVRKKHSFEAAKAGRVVDI